MMKNKKLFLQLLRLSFLIVLFLCNLTSAQEVKNVFLENTDKENRFYEEAFQNIDNMLNDKQEYSFKNAVFGVENAYYQGKLDVLQLEREINFLKAFSGSILKSRELNYSESDKNNVSKYAAVFSIMCQSLPVMVKDTVIQYKPFNYDFEDVFGHKEISNLFVSKLLLTKKGNCNSMPYLYKILAEELGVDANLALAPNHVYIKHRIKAVGWYNTELTSGIFPEDGWLMASGYIHLDAIKNGVFMKALNNKESLALCLFDLAQAYNKSFPENDGSFVLNCTKRAVEVYPYFAKALILKAETHKKMFEKVMKEENLSTDNPENIKLALRNPKAKELFDIMKKEYGYIYEIGYRQMPEEMYLDWLVSLKTERSKYENKKLNNFVK
ncbi:YdeI/OmpD-associated family protein [Chryseobacterium gambrini]|uniref:YdeI/OmpD-associated family protein n=2 Tax=Chryseobacterium gambrini TaxID=373672 RepID=A0ABM8KA88_9FLAO|nr:YdeI/OmpD-associated family protein [Chryseobacterium gambrini]